MIDLLKALLPVALLLAGGCTALSQRAYSGQERTIARMLEDEKCRTVLVEIVDARLQSQAERADAEKWRFSTGQAAAALGGTGALSALLAYLAKQRGAGHADG